MNSNTIAARLEAAGVDTYSINYDRGVIYAFCPGLLGRETIRQTEERRQQEFQKRYYWTGFELRRRDGNG
jgi:hypothetical protein